MSENRILITLPKDKSILTVGNLAIKTTKKFNWLEKKMLKYLLGIKIVDIQEEQE